MSLLSDKIRVAVNSSSGQAEALHVWIWSSSKQPSEVRLDQQLQSVVLTLYDFNDFNEAFDYRPGFKFVHVSFHYDLNEEGLEKLCSVLASYPFEHFSIQFWQGVNTQIAGLIVEALSLNSSRLKELTLSASQFDDNKEVNGQSTLPKLLRRHSTLSTLRLIGWPLSACDVAILASALASNSPPLLQTFEIWYSKPLSYEGFRALFASFATNTTLHSFTLTSISSFHDDFVTLALALSNNTTLQSLQLYGHIASCAPEIILSSKTLTSLTAGNSFGSEPILDVVRIMRALEKNTTLTSFSFGGYQPAAEGMELYEAIIDLLSINFTLQTLDLTGTPLAQNRAWMSTINDMLYSSKANEELRAVLGSFPRVQPSTARVFFCGQGFAGKTTLRTTMTNLLDISFGKKVKQFVRKNKQLVGRTAGIEVTSVNHSNLEIFFWDLAGQREYHALHDLMFPNEQGPSLFLIVCSLTDNSSHPDCKDHPKKMEEILGELRYWLRYISSNTEKISRRTPHVIFVFTHEDMLTSLETAPIIKGQVEDHTMGLTQEFESVAKVVGTFFIDSHKPNSVRAVLQHVLKESAEIVNCCQSIFSVCNNARSMLAEWMKDHPHEPWMQVNDFIKLCRRKLPDFKISSSFERHEKANDSIMAVLNSLHQTGSLIYFQNLGIVLINLQWFCKDFMGGILETTTQVSEFVSDDHKGIWKRGEIKGILERLYNARNASTRLGGPLDVEHLINIMLQLELCFEMDSGHDLFIPATLCRSELQTHRRWTADVERPASEFGHVGRRLKCADEKHTFLTPGFFPRLQVHLRNKFEGLPYELEKDLIRIVDDRFEVLIEFNEAPTSFIDIMVRFLKSKDLDHVLEFISNKVILNIRHLQSITKCCQGVYLVEVALRPSCVTDLILPEFKMKQCVSLEELSSRLLDADLVHDIEEITYPWDSLRTANLGQQYTPIIELLGKIHFRGLLATRLVNVEELSKQLGIPDYGVSSSWSNIMDPSFGMLKRTKSILTERDAGLYALQSQMERMEVKVDAIARDMKDVKGAVHMLLEQKKRLMPEVEKLLAKIQNLSHHADSTELPRLFVFSKHKSLLATLVPGLSNFKLHFMCENRSMPHLLSDQKGIEITTLDEGAVKRILPYVQFLLSTVSLGFKLGAPLAQAHGFMVPDLSSLIDNSISASRGIVYRSKMPRDANDEDACTIHSGNIGFDPVVIRKARIWLQEFMQEKRCDKESSINDKFRLFKKQFEDGRCAWLCDEHYRHAPQA